MARIQRRQEADTRWTVQSHPGFFYALIFAPLSADCESFAYIRVAFLQTSCLRLKRLDGGSPTALVSDCVGLLKACLFILF